MTARFLLLAISLLPLSAQQKGFEVRPSTIPGIEVYAPGTPVFEAAIATLVPDGSKREALKPAIQRSLVLKNSGTRKVVMVNLLSEFIAPDGRSASGTTRVFAPGMIAFPPGDVYVSSPDLGLGHAIAQSAQFSAERLEKEVAAILERSHYMLASPYLIVSVDAAMFEDREFAGPDRAELRSWFLQLHSTVVDLTAELTAVGKSETALAAKLSELRQSIAPNHDKYLHDAMIVQLQRVLSTGGYDAFDTALKTLWPLDRYPAPR